MNDIDITVGVKDLATAVLDKLSSKVGSIGDVSKSAFAGAAERLNDQLSKASGGVSSAASAAGFDKLARAIDSAASGLSTKLDTAIAKTNSSIDRVIAKVQGAISSIQRFIERASGIATVGAAFITLSRGVQFATGRVAELAMGNNLAEQSSQKLRTGLLNSIAPIGKYVVVTSATLNLAKATMDASSATSGLVTRLMAVARGSIAAVVLRSELKRTEGQATTLAVKLIKVAGFALAAETATRATVRFGLSMLGLGRKADLATTSIAKTVNAAKTIATVPLRAVTSGAASAAAATANLGSKLDDLPKGAQSVEKVVSSFATFASQIGGVAGLLLSIPAGIAGVAFAIVAASGKTERQLVQLTNKLALIEAAKLNISIDDIDTAPLRKVAEDTEKIAKQIQTATNVQSSKLISLATSALPKGLDSKQIGEALKAATGLSEVYGTSIDDGMYRARQAIQGNFESFETLIPAIKTMTSDSDKLAAVSRLAANGFKVMASESTTFWGTIEKVKNGLGNTIEALGRMRSLSDVVGTILRDVVAPAVEFLDSKLKGFGFNGTKVLEQAKAIGAGVIAAIETIGSNWGSIIDRMTIAGQLFWVQLTSQVENFVNNTLPWLGENFSGVMEHAWAKIQNGYKSGFGLMVTAAQEKFGMVKEGTTMAEAVKQALSNQQFKPSALPAMKGRNISSQENILQGKLNVADAKIATSFSANFTKALGSLDGMLKDAKGVFDVDLKLNVPPVAPAVTEEKGKTKAATENLQAFSSRLLTRGPSQDAARFTAQNTAQTVALLRKSYEQQRRAIDEQMRTKGRLTTLTVVK